MKTTYKVSGMTCGGCATSVTRALAAVAPATAVRVSLEAGTITVEGPHEEDTIARAVQEAGFEFGGRAQ